MAGKIKGITIEIGGDSTKLDKALRESTQRSKDLEKELKNVNKALKFDPKNTELLNQKQRLLTQSISETKDRLNLLKESQSQLQEQFERGEIGVETFEAIKEEIGAAESELKRLEGELEKFGSVGAQKIAAVGEQMKDVGGKIEGAGKKMSVISGGIAAVGGTSLALASSFEDAMAKVNTIADTSEISLDNLRQQITDLSNQTGISADEIADATYNAISAGQNTADAVNFVSNATSLARAGFADTGASIDLLTTIMNAYGLEASEVGKVSDILIQTQNKGKTTVAELSSAMGKVIPTANSMNVNLENLAAGYSIMTAKGIATAESTTYMNSMLNELGKGGTKVSEALKEKTGKSFQDLMRDGSSLGEVLKILQDYAESTGVNFNDLWGSAEAGKAGITLLSDGVESFNSAVKGMGDSTGATAAAIEKLETPSQKAKVAINEIKNTGIDLGSTLLTMLQPIIKDISEDVKSFTTWFSELDDGTKNTILTVAGIVAAIGPVLIIIGKVISSVGTILTVVPKVVGIIKTVAGGAKALWGVLSANPIGIVITVIAALVAAFVGLYKHNEKFRKFVDGIWAKIKSVFGNLPKWFSDKISSITNTVKSGLNKVKDFFTGLKLKLPNIKLPHFKLNGSFSLKPPSVPKLQVDWYAKAMDDGMILDAPTIFGMNRSGQLMGAGEVPGRSEAVVGTDSLRGMIDASVKNALAGMKIGLYIDGRDMTRFMDTRLGTLQTSKGRGAV